MLWRASKGFRCIKQKLFGRPMPTPATRAQLSRTYLPANTVKRNPCRSYAASCHRASRQFSSLQRFGKIWKRKMGYIVNITLQSDLCFTCVKFWDSLKNLIGKIQWSYSACKSGWPILMLLQKSEKLSRAGRNPVKISIDFILLWKTIFSGAGEFKGAVQLWLFSKRLVPFIFRPGRADVLQSWDGVQIFLG